MSTKIYILIFLFGYLLPLILAWFYFRKEKDYGCFAVTFLLLPVFNITPAIWLIFESLMDADISFNWLFLRRK